MEGTTLTALPEAVAVNVFTFVNARDAVRAAGAARACLEAVRSPALWSAFARAAYERLVWPGRPDKVTRARDVSGRLFLQELQTLPGFVEGALNARLWAFVPRFWPSSVNPRRQDRLMVASERMPTYEYISAGLSVARYPRQPRHYVDFCAIGPDSFDIYGKPEEPSGDDWWRKEDYGDVGDPLDICDCSLPVRRLVIPTPRGGWQSVTGAYFEVAIRRESPSFGNTPFVAVGLCTSKFYSVGKQPGWTRSSFGYHGDDGLVHNGGEGVDFGFSTFGAGDVVGCGQCRTSSGGSAIYFTLNGRCLGIAFGFDPEEEQELLYPVVGMDHGSLRVAVNLGARPFAFPHGAAAEDLFRTMADAHAKYRRGISEEELRAIARSPR